MTKGSASASKRGRRVSGALPRPGARRRASDDPTRPRSRGLATRSRRETDPVADLVAMSPPTNHVDRRNEGGGNSARFASIGARLGSFPKRRTRNGGAGHEQEPEEQGEDGVAPHFRRSSHTRVRLCVEYDDPRPRSRRFFLQPNACPLDADWSFSWRSARRSSESAESLLSRGETVSWEARVISARRPEPRAPVTRGRRSSAPPPRAGGAEEASPAAR
jgi:hypothetical protein